MVMMFATVAEEVEKLQKMTIKDMKKELEVSRS